MTRRPPSDLTVLASYYARWEPYEAKRREIADDLKELFKELKGDGLNAKSARKAFAEFFRIENQTNDEAEKRAENDADFELYMAALARVREDDEEIPPHDEDGVILETSSTAARKDVPVATTVQAQAKVPDALPTVAGTQAPPVETIQAETPNEIPSTTKGGDDESRSAAEPAVNIPGRRRHANGGEAHDAAAAENTNGAAAPQVTNPGDNDVAPSPAHAPEQPGTDHGSVNPPSEGGANSDALPIATAVSPQPAGADRSGVATSSLPGSAPVTFDRTKPHPFCKDPEDCGVIASWEQMCLSCHRTMEKAQLVAAE